MKTATVLLAITCAAIVMASPQHNDHAASPAPEKKSNCCAKPADATNAATAQPLPDASLYQLTSTWTTDTGKKIQLSELRGKPQVVTMFFAQCQTACPLLAHDMHKIDAALPVELRSSVGFVLISFDTERDTPEALAAFRKAHKLPPNWTLLTATPDDVLEIAALLGIKFKKEPTGQYAHSNVISVVSPDGEVIHQQIGLQRDPTPAVEALNKLAAHSDPHTSHTTPSPSESAKPKCRCCKS